jgi:aspartate oxidase
MTNLVERELQKINKQLWQIDRTLRSLTKAMHRLQELSRYEQKYTTVGKNGKLGFGDDSSLHDAADAVVAEWVLRMSP